MKLFLNNTSPYSRMVRIVMLEHGLADRVELAWCDPWSDDEDLLRANPLARIPTLVLDSGMAISESILIASYLDSIGKTSHSLVPKDRKEGIFHLMGLALGIMDAAFSIVISRKYLDKNQEDAILGRRRFKGIGRSLDTLEQSIQTYSKREAITLGDISFAVSLEYLAFRLPELNTMEQYPNLELWRSDMSARDSFKATHFH